MAFIVDQFNFRGTHTASIGMAQDKLVFAGGVASDPFNWTLTGSRMVNNEADIGLNSKNAQSWLAVERISDRNKSATLFISGSVSGSALLNAHDPRQIMSNVVQNAYTIRDLSNTTVINTNYPRSGWKSGVSVIGDDLGQKWFVHNEPLYEPSYPSFYVSASDEVVVKNKLIIGSPNPGGAETSGSEALQVWGGGGNFIIKAGNSAFKGTTGARVDGLAVVGHISASDAVYIGGGLHVNKRGGSVAIRMNAGQSLASYAINDTGPNTLIKVDDDGLGNNTMTLGSTVWKNTIFYYGGSNYMYMSGSGGIGFNDAFPFRGLTDYNGAEIKKGLQIDGAVFANQRISGSSDLRINHPKQEAWAALITNKNSTEGYGLEINAGAVGSDDGILKCADFTGANERLRVTPTGVGLNKWNPAAKLHVDGTIRFDNLPTSDPGVAGAVWNDSTTLKISAG